MKQLHTAGIGLHMIAGVLRPLAWGALLVLIPAVAFCNPNDISTEIRQRLYAGVDANFAGDYDRAWEIFEGVADLDPTHPSREFYQAVVLFWKNNVDPNNPRYDDQIRRLLQASIAKSETMLKEKPRSVEALHFLGLEYTYLGRLEAHRGHLYSGGVKGETGRKYLERAVDICRDMSTDTGDPAKEPRPPDCEDIYFPLGAYSYFAGRLPAFLKWMNFLWFIPQGSTEEGLRDLERAARNSRLHKPGALALLMSIDSIFETDRIAEALSISKDLHRQFPDNPYLDLERARVLLVAGQYEDAVRHADSIMGMVKDGKANYGPVVAYYSQLIKAEALIMGNRLKAAEALLIKMSINRSLAQNTHTGQLYLLLGMLADARGHRSEALRWYDKSLDLKDRFISRMVKKQVKAYMDQPFSLRSHFKTSPRAQILR